ncbi:MAG: PsbP-related protein, partial [Candidatus Nitrosopolaris sp.]
MYNKILPSVSIMIMIGSLSSVATSNMLYRILPQEAIAQTTEQRNHNDNNNMLTYENSTYGIRMQYPSEWHKEENVSGGSDNNSMLVDVVKFSSHSKNSSDTFSETL